MIQWGKADCSWNTRVCSRLDIVSYPQIVLVINDVAYRFDGRREAGAIEDFTKNFAHLAIPKPVSACTDRIDFTPAWSSVCLHIFRAHNTCTLWLISVNYMNAKKKVKVPQFFLLSLVDIAEHQLSRVRIVDDLTLNSALVGFMVGDEPSPATRLYL